MFSTSLPSKIPYNSSWSSSNFSHIPPFLFTKTCQSVLACTSVAMTAWDIYCILPIKIYTFGLPARLSKALSKMAEIWECLLMKLTADQYFLYYLRASDVQSLSYSSFFVSIRQPSWFWTDNAKFKRKYYEQAVQIYYVNDLTLKGRYSGVIVVKSEIQWEITSSRGRNTIFWLDNLNLKYNIWNRRIFALSSTAKQMIVRCSLSQGFNRYMPTFSKANAFCFLHVFCRLIV